MRNILMIKVVYCKQESQNVTTIIEQRKYIVSPY